MGNELLNPPQLPDSPAITVRKDPGAAAATAAAIGRYAEPIHQAGVFFDQYDKQRQQSEDFAITTKLKVSREQRRDEIISEMENAQIPVEKRPEYFSNRFKDYGATDVPNLSEAGQLEWERDQGLWMAREEVNQKTAMRKAKNLELRGWVEKAVNLAIDQGDQKSGDDIIEMGLKRGAYDAYTAAQMEEKLHNGIDLSKASAEIRGDDPDKVLEDLRATTPKGRFKNYKSLSESQRGALETRARTEINRRSLDLYHSIYESRVDPSVQDTDWDEIDMMHDEGKLSTAHKNALYNGVFNKAKLTYDPAKAAKINHMIETYQGRPDPTFEEEAKIKQFIMASGLPDKEVTSLWSRVEKIKKNGGEESRTAAFKQAHDFVKDAYTKGFLGPIGFDPTDPESRNAQDYMNTQFTKSALTEALDGYEKTNPNAKPQDIMQFINGQMKKSRDLKASGNWDPYGDS